MPDHYYLPKKGGEIRGLRSGQVIGYVPQDPLEYDEFLTLNNYPVQSVQPSSNHGSSLMVKPKAKPDPKRWEEFTLMEKHTLALAQPKAYEALRAEHLTRIGQPERIEPERARLNALLEAQVGSAT